MHIIVCLQLLPLLISQAICDFNVEERCIWPSAVNTHGLFGRSISKIGVVLCRNSDSPSFALVKSWGFCQWVGERLSRNLAECFHR